MRATKATAAVRGGQKQNTDTKGFVTIVLGWIAGVGAALLATVVLIVLEALLLKWSNLSDAWLMAGNYLIRLAALWIGAGVFSSRAPQLKGWLRGVMLGAGYWLCMYLAYAMTGGQTAMLGVVVTDILLCLAIGVLASAWSGHRKHKGSAKSFRK